MGRGSSKAGVAGGNIKNITQINSAGGLKALQKEAKGTPAEQWYNESGQNYDQLRAMESIYDIPRNLKTVRSHDDIAKNPDLSAAKSLIDNAPNGTIVSYDIGNSYVVMKKGPSGQWQSMTIRNTNVFPVVDLGSLEKYGDVKALNMFAKLQKNGLRRSLSGRTFEAYRNLL